MWSEVHLGSLSEKQNHQVTEHLRGPQRPLSSTNEQPSLTSVRLCQTARVYSQWDQSSIELKKRREKTVVGYTINYQGQRRKERPGNPSEKWLWEGPHRVFSKERWAEDRGWRAEMWDWRKKVKVERQVLPGPGLEPHLEANSHLRMGRQ